MKSWPTTTPIDVTGTPAGAAPQGEVHHDHHSPLHVLVDVLSGLAGIT